jgi:hypothetical protein
MIQTLDAALCQSYTQSSSPLGAPGLRSLELPQKWWPTARVCEGIVEEDERWVKMVAKEKLSTLGYWGVYIGEGSTRLEENRDIKSLPSLHIFLKRDHTAYMQVHTNQMPFFVAANDFCYPVVLQLT